MSSTTLTPPATRRTVLDPAHVGDIHGAFGTVRAEHRPPRSARRRLLMLLAIMGPGLIVNGRRQRCGRRRHLPEVTIAA